jgi:ATP-binding cassette, subfamily B, bacterial CvaB/MchF/RaxB
MPNSRDWQTWLRIGRRRRPELLLQTEAAECGLACLGMIAAWHGHLVDLPTLRRRFAISMKGTTLRHLGDIAARMNLSSRAVRLDLDELADLRTPCILHWDLDHFVVLVRATRAAIRILDPATGERHMTLAAASPHFTGVALEVTPTESFVPKVERRTVPLRSLTGRTVGLNRSFLQVIVLALSLELTVLASPFFMQWVVDGAIVSADRDLLLLLALGFSLLVVLQAALALARSWVVLFVSTHLSLQWSDNVLGHLLRLPMSWFERRHMGDVVSRFGAVAAIQRTLTNTLVESVIDGLLAAGTLLLMLLYSAGLTAIAIASVLLYALLRWAAYGPLRAATEEQIILNARATSLFIESVRAIAAIKLFGHEDQRRSASMNATVNATNRMLATEKMALLFRSAQTLLHGIENVVIVYFGALAVIEGGLSVGMLFAFASYRATFSARVGALVDRSIQVAMLRLQAERLADIVLERAEEAGPGHAEVDAGDSTLEVRGLSFRYGDAEPWVLRDLSLSIAPGECVAITGSSGCGKTTLLKILLGLLTPTEGEVVIGGRPIARLGLRRYRELVGAVMQEDHLLAGSIAENIAFFDASPDRRRVEACAKAAAVHDDICAMPMGYATLIGDMGSSLSGGERQRILLARALYKRPKLLFLDEATSHLDVKKEHAINAAIGTMRFTRILVAHRPQTIASADRLVVLDRGTIRQDVRLRTPAEPPRSA